MKRVDRECWHRSTLPEKNCLGNAFPGLDVQKLMLLQPWSSKACLILSWQRRLASSILGRRGCWQALIRVAGSWVLTPRFQMTGMGLKDLVLCHWKLVGHDLFFLNVYQMFISGMFHLKFLERSWLRVAYGKQQQGRKETATFAL